jgi:hypothetical protein
LYNYTNIKTTESYLDSFDRETKRELASLLSSFKKKEQLNGSKEAEEA